MKKSILSSLIILFFILFNINVYAKSYKFIWDESTTFINVSLGDNINKYTNIPKANLYIDNVLMEDAEVSYLTTGDWLYLLTDVDTSRVGEYKVWYKAFETKYSPGQCEGYKTLVTFNVIDDEPPVIKSIPDELTYLIGTNKPVYESYILVNDNSGKFNIVVDDSSVLYNVVGEYVVNIIVDDGYNVVNSSIKLYVKDPVGPIITFIGENNTIKLNVGDTIDLKPYFTAVDNIDGNVINSIRYENFDTKEEKEFQLEVRFNDSNYNYSSIFVNVVIVDENEPVINLINETLILEYNTDYLLELKNNIKEAYVGKLDIKNDVIIDISNIKESVGVYTITYSYTYKEKQVSKVITVNVLSSVAPTLILENFESAIGKKPDYYAHISVIDESDPYISTKIDIDDSNVDYYYAGRYPVYVSVLNSSGLSKTDTLYVTIIEDKTLFSNNDGEENKNYLIAGILIVFVAVVGIIWYNKKKKNKNISNI